MIQLGTSGLSMSQAQSLSNICYQRGIEIDAIISKINNFSRSIIIEGKEFPETQGNKMPDNIIDLILEKGKLSAVQAFLMEAIKQKEAMMIEVKSKNLTATKFYEEYPEPKYEPIQHVRSINKVDEDWGWKQLTSTEYVEYLENEAYASHIGQFIHAKGKLTQLRTALPNIKLLDFIEIESGKKTPMKINIHHESEELMHLYEQFAAKHRLYEQRVNYFKAKVKNLVSYENARINKENAEAVAKYTTKVKILDADYNQKMALWSATYEKLQHEFEVLKEDEIKRISTLRIVVDTRVKATIDLLLSNISE